MNPLAAMYWRLRHQPRNFLAIGILITLVFFGLSSGHLPLSPTANADSQRLVSLYADGQKRVFATDATTVRQVLQQSGVPVGPADLVEPGLDTPTPTQGFFNINVYRARPVLVQDGSRVYRITSAYQSPHLLAEAAGVKTYPQDQYSTSVITNFVNDDGAIGVQVDVERATPMTVEVDGQTDSIRTQAKTVGDALKGAGVALGLKDTVSVRLDAPVVAGMDVAVTRVSDVETTVTTPLPRAVETTTNPAMLKGQTMVKAEGSDGQKTAVYWIHYRNGVETGRDLVQVVSETDSAPRIVVVGTKVLFAGSVEYWRPQVVAIATQYGLDPNMMLRIMACESSGNATSVSNFVVNGQHPMGLFQYLPSTWEAAGGTMDNILDGPTQIQLTARKMAAQGTKAWQCQ